MISALCAGLLTIGNRFGGAVNEAAKNWIDSVSDGLDAKGFVESFAVESKIIAGIGHKKYRIDNPDPRVKELTKFTNRLKVNKYLKFAKEVEKITTDKKANLILNADGAIAAAVLDILTEKEGFTVRELRELAETEFFNALFIIPRSVGFIAHFLDQKRLDEGLFRLPISDISYVNTNR